MANRTYNMAPTARLSMLMQATTPEMIMTDFLHFFFGLIYS